LVMFLRLVFSEVSSIFNNWTFRWSSSRIHCEIISFQIDSRTFLKFQMARRGDERRSLTVGLHASETLGKNCSLSREQVDHRSPFFQDVVLSTRMIQWDDENSRSTNRWVSAKILREILYNRGKWFASRKARPIQHLNQCRNNNLNQDSSSESQNFNL
jgi:hypothetical protein